MLFIKSDRSKLSPVLCMFAMVARLIPSFLTLFLWIASECHFSFVNFDDAMSVQQNQHIVAKHNNKKLLSFFRQLYHIQEKQVSLNDVHQLRIPKVMHHIWFGIPFSKDFKQLRQTWIDMHPQWIFIFWTDRPENDSDAYCVRTFQELNEVLEKQIHTRIVVDVRALQFDNRSYFDATNNYGERSDILKWEVVYRYGGVYIDTDFECYYPLDSLHELFDFYTGLQPLDTGYVQLGAALYGARPGHPILARCVTDIRPAPGPIVIRTGPIHFTHCFIKEALGAQGNTIALPSSYFYPCGYEQQDMSPKIWKKNESFGVHHWSGSWLKPEGFVQ